MTNDDKANLDDLHQVAMALSEAQLALTEAMVGHANKREEFVFKIGFARGRLERVSSRIYGEHVPPLPDDEPSYESDP